MNMRKLKFLLVLIVALFVTELHSDIIVVDPIQANVCVRIVNLNEFPDIAVIGLHSNCFALSKSNRAYQIKTNSCLRVNKACPLTLYVVKKEYLRKKELDVIDWSQDKNVQKLNLSVKTKSVNSYDYSSVVIEFKLARHKGTTYYLYKSKMTYKYQNDRSDSVRNLKNDIVDPLKPISVSTENAIR